MNRRTTLAIMGGSALEWIRASTLQAAAESQRPYRLGLVTYCCRYLRERQIASRDLFEPFTFLEHCRSIGAGGMQANLGTLSQERCDALLALAAEHSLFIEAIVRLPQDETDVDRFDAEMETARRVGAAAARTTIIPGRRYEFFDSLEKFREFERRGRESLERAAPIAERHRVPVAVENHKDQRNAERVSLFKHIGSEYVGACVDTGNSFALLEDPLETVRSLAPWAHSVHLKDQAVQLYEDGFLLGDIPLGEGFLDLKQMVDILREQKPDVQFSLELITRDPLKVPCLTEAYWATFPNLPAHDLARTLRQVRAGAAAELQQVSGLSPEEQVALETANVKRSLQYAHEHLGL